MPQIVLTIRHDDGTTSERTFTLTGAVDNLDAIDEAVEQFKNAALPQVEQDLLAHAQDQIITQEKKTVSDQQRQ